MKIKDKRIKKLAERIYALEKAHQDTNLSSQEKTQIEEQIMNLSKKVMTMPNAFEVMAIIDEYCLEKLEKN